MTTELLDFEHIAPKNSFAVMPAGYGGFNWSTDDGVEDRGYIKKTYGHTKNGFKGALHGNGVAYASDLEAAPGYASVALTRETAFDFKSGVFATDFGKHVVVVDGYADRGEGLTIVAHKVLHLSTHSKVESFGHSFKNITELLFTTTLSHGGNGGHFAFDNLSFDVSGGAGAVHMPGVHVHDHAHHDEGAAAPHEAAMAEAMLAHDQAMHPFAESAHIADLTMIA